MLSEFSPLGRIKFFLEDKSWNLHFHSYLLITSGMVTPSYKRGWETVFIPGSYGLSQLSGLHLVQRKGLVQANVFAEGGDM